MICLSLLFIFLLFNLNKSILSKLYLRKEKIQEGYKILRKMYFKKEGKVGKKEKQMKIYWKKEEKLRIDSVSKIIISNFLVTNLVL